MKEDKMKRHLFVATVFLTVAMLPVLADTVNVEVMVLDDATGLPLEGVCVTGYFTEDIGWRAWTESSVPNRAEALTDKCGLCRVSGKTNCGKVGCWIETPPNGYYCPPRGWGHTYTNKNLFGVWQPDNLVATIRLQRVEHPIPLWVKDVKLKMKPEEAARYDGTNAVWRYDLMVGDWLPPAGQGIVADIVVSGNYRFDGMIDGVSKFSCYEYSHLVEFQGKGNGIFEKYGEPQLGIKIRQAPESGYGHSVKGCFGRKKMLYGVNIFPELYSDEDPNRCYAFRIRSRYDEKGNLVEAYYGKIYGGFSFKRLWNVGGQQPVFFYYLNPTSLDRNLEWDMKNNLCPNPGSLGQLQP